MNRRFDNYTLFLGLDMTITTGVSRFNVIINPPKSMATEELSKTTVETAAKRLGLEEEEALVVRMSKDEDESGSAKGKGASIAVRELIERMKELQQLLRQQQQQLAAAQAASYPTPEGKATTVMGIQGQMANTNAALQQVAAALAKELSSESMASSMIDTTA